MRFLRANRMLLLVAGAILGGYAIWTGHGGHALGYLPYAILLACPLMHIFMHGGHGHRRKRDDAHDHAPEASGDAPREDPADARPPRPRASDIPKVAARRD